MEDMGDASLIGWHTWRQGEVKSLSSQSFARGLEGQYGRAERQSNETGDRSAKLRMFTRGRNHGRGVLTEWPTSQIVEFGYM